MTKPTIVGRLTGDPELRFTPSGKAVAEFTLADNHRKKQPDGTWADDGTTFYRCSAWGDLAENVAATLAKGQLAIVVGDLRLREYDRKDGGKGASLNVRVDHVGALITRKSQAQQAASGWGQPAEQSAGGASWDNPPF